MFTVAEERRDIADEEVGKKTTMKNKRNG